MSKLPLVSIVLPCYNAQDTIYDTLLSISNQKFQDFEVIFVNDGSVDDSLTIAEQFLSSLDIKIISRENKGFLISLEEGISLSRGTYIARIDADDIWKSNHLELILNKFFENSKLVLIGSNAIYINEKNEQIGLTHLNITHTSITKALLKDNPFIHSSVVFKKSAYKQTQGYLIGKDEKSKHISDYNLWFELSKTGECANIQKHTVLYRILDSSMSRQIDKCINYRARLSIMKKVYAHYNEYHLFYFFELFKIKYRLYQYCYIKRLFNEN